VTLDRHVRLAQHAVSGFTVEVQVVESLTIAQCYRAERAIKLALNRAGIEPAKKPDTMRFGGWTETYLTAQAPWLSLTPYAEQAAAALQPLRLC